MSRWHDGNGFSSWYTACARVGYDPRTILANLRKECDRCSMPNLVLTYGGGGIENVSGFLALNEMLLQSHEGVLRFFPVWPKEQDARFGSLRAVGAFLVSAELKNGVVRAVTIRSEKGRACTVQNPWPGKNVQLVRNGKTTETATGARFTMRTAAGQERRNSPAWAEPVELTGGWDVAFDPRWGGPESVRFESLVSWPQREEPGIKHYSGKATYRKSFDLPARMRNVKLLRLNLGAVKNVAEVRLNGRNLGVVWAEPFQVEITGAVKAQDNKLEIDVVNLWPNRMIGDAALPAEQRSTRSNVTMDRNAKLLPSGLFGPVCLQPSQEEAK